MQNTSVAVLLAKGEAPPDGLDLVAPLADVHLADDAITLAQALRRTDVLFVWDFRTDLLQAPWPEDHSVRWIQTGSIGVDAVLVDQVIDSDIVLTNTRGVFERPIAEYVLAVILMFAKDLHGTLALQRERRWVHRETETVTGARALILGAGGVAREVAPLLRAAGMQVQVVGRTARTGDPLLGDVGASTDVDELLPDADFVVLALPLTSETRGFLDERRLGLLDPRARIINIGRGALIDEDALLAALRAGAIAGAALDVFVTEPLSPEHPFWEMDRVLVSPHMSGDRIGWERDVLASFADNLRRWLAGDELHNVVEKRGA
ncbi:MAG TPA: D-2-hydroxyacid dehydrogenase [Solirubrobacteraceae bacterium]|nr:D-2-hydroxyacid dehydrogenase [Solirubrobacteraceae bacterium]